MFHTRFYLCKTSPSHVDQAVIDLGVQYPVANEPPPLQGIHKVGADVATNPLLLLRHSSVLRIPLAVPAGTVLPAKRKVHKDRTAKEEDNLV